MTRGNIRKVGLVELSYYGEIARCTKCGKSLTYKLPMSMARWKETSKAFIATHQDCKAQ